MFEIAELTDYQQQAIEELRSRIEHDLTPKMLADETLLYRFLKARNFRVEEAEAMIRKSIADRNTYGIENILTEYKPYKNIQHIYPISFVGYDIEMSSVHYIDLGGADIKGIVNLLEASEIYSYTAYYFEKYLDNMKKETEVGIGTGKFVFIINMHNLTLSKVTFEKGINVMREGFKLFQDNYPEQMKAAYVINAPFIFKLLFAAVKTVLAASIIDKIRDFGNTGWQNFLLEKIDADVLPAFLGGRHTDPDGNPKCESFICHGKLVPRKFLLNEPNHSILGLDGVEIMTVKNRSSSKIDIVVKEPKTKLQWEFETEKGNVDFALYYKDNSSNGLTAELIPSEKIDIELSCETGFFYCTEIGTYIIVLSNTYWFTSIEVSYRIRLIQDE